MIALKFSIGILLLMLGWICFFKPNLILSINRFFREVVFNDRSILLERKKLTVLFVLLGLSALYVGFNSLTRYIALHEDEKWEAQSTRYLMYMAMQDYLSERYDNSIAKYERVLEISPGNIEAMKRMAYVYQALGRKKEAAAILKRVIKLNPDEETASRNKKL